VTSGAWLIIDGQTDSQKIRTTDITTGLHIASKIEIRKETNKGGVPSIMIKCDEGEAAQRTDCQPLTTLFWPKIKKQKPPGVNNSCM